jgi:hypothetical protein
MLYSLHSFEFGIRPYGDRRALGLASLLDVVSARNKTMAASAPNIIARYELSPESGMMFLCIDDPPTA